MNERPITGEDLTLYALDLMPAEERDRIELLLRSSTQARGELALIRGDLATFALATAQHTPPALTRQRLMKQIARERRTLPIPVAMDAEPDFAVDTPRYVPDEPLQPQRRTQETAGKVRLPRVMSAPEPVLLPDPPALPVQEAAYVSDASAPAPPPSRTASMFEQYFNGEPAGSDPVAPRGGPALRAAQRPQPAEVEAEPAGEDRYEPSPKFAFSSFGEAEPEQTSRRGVSPFAWSGWATAAILAVVALFFVRQNYTLQQKAEAQTAALTQSRSEAERAELVMQTMSSSAAQRFVLTRSDASPVPSGRVAYLPEHGSLVFQGSNLEALPPYKTYELWLIPIGQGRQPVPAGTFKPDVRGFASVVLPTLPAGTIAGNFGVTVEDVDGSATPTLPILLIGQQS